MKYSRFVFHVHNYEDKIKLFGYIHGYIDNLAIRRGF